MATVTTINVGSGLPLNDLLTSLETAEKERLAPLATERSNNTAKITAYGTISSSLTALQTSITALKQAKTFTPTTATASGTGVTVAAGASAVAGSYQVKVNSLASAMTVASEGFASKTDAISGTGTLSIGVAGKSVDISIAEGSTLETIRNQINNANAGVNATIVNTGDAANPYKLTISSKETGVANEASISFSGTGDLQTKLSDAANGGTLTQVQAAADASLEVNGIAITSPSNTLEEAIGGVSMTLNTAGSTQTVTVAKDNDAVAASIQSFVDAYNTYIKATQTATAYNDDPDLSGKLLGDGTLRNIKSSISSTLNTAQTGEYAIMAQFGISLTADGTLSVDSDKLTTSLAGNSEAITSFFTGTEGFATRMDKTLNNILGDEGTLTRATDGLTAANKSLEEAYGKMEDDIAATMARYKTQFTALDSLVSKNNSTLAYIKEQFSLMASSSDD